MQLADVARQTNAWACYDCGKCTALCPLTRAGAEYSPRRHVLATNLRQQETIVEDATIMSCLTCSRCDQSCPAEVSYTELMMALRELSFGARGEPSCPHGGALHSVMRMMAQGGSQQQRLGWLDDELEVEATTGEVLYFTGCTMYYDAFFAEHGVATLNGTKAAIKILNRLGITPVVSADERCCGHDLLFSGDRASFEALAKANVALIEASGAKQVVVGCAECLRTLKLDYQPFFGDAPPRLLHISELVAENLRDLDLAESAPQQVTFQDPCRLGRHLGIYDPPREVLAAVPGLTLVEMASSRSRALCCAGGCFVSCDRYAKKIQVERLTQARATGSEVLVTACPKCQVHLACAMRDPNLGNRISINMRDVAELVADAL